MNTVIINNGIAIDQCTLDFKFVTSAFQRVNDSVVKIILVCKYIVISHIAVKLIFFQLSCNKGSNRLQFYCHRAINKWTCLEVFIKMFLECKTSDSSSNIQIMFGSSRRSRTPFASPYFFQIKSHPVHY